MKKLYFLIFLSLILFGLAVVIVSRVHHSTEKSIAQKEEQWNKEKLELQDELTEISAKIEELKTQKTELDNPELDPQDPEVLYALAKCLKTGNGVEANEDDYRKLLRQAAEAGYESAIEELDSLDSIDSSLNLESTSLNSECS